MDGVAAEIAEEVGVLLQHDRVDAGARQQEAGHHSGGPAANDDTSAAQRRGHRLSIALAFAAEPRITPSTASRS
jgi:hypothetical protein